MLWDQGEANMDEGFMLRREQYACLFRELIFSWRQARAGGEGGGGSFRGVIPGPIATALHMSESGVGRTCDGSDRRV